jgi:hypothetical protein
MYKGTHIYIGSKAFNIFSESLLLSLRSLSCPFRRRGSWAPPSSRRPDRSATRRSNSFLFTSGAKARHQPVDPKCCGQYENGSAQRVNPCSRAGGKAGRHDAMDPVARGRSACRTAAGSSGATGNCRKNSSRKFRRSWSPRPVYRKPRMSSWSFQQMLISLINDVCFG